MKLPMTTWQIREIGYPPGLKSYLGVDAPIQVPCLGYFKDRADTSFEAKTLALFCSATAPANTLLTVHDLAQQWRQGERTIISGFHSLVEQEAYTILLRGPGRVIHCPARSLTEMRLSGAQKAAIEAGYLLLVSPFADTVRRGAAETAHFRNRFVAALADEILIAYAHPGGKTESLVRKALGWGKPVYTIAHEVNQDLLKLGVIPFPSGKEEMGQRGKT